MRHNLYPTATRAAGVTDDVWPQCTSNPAVYSMSLKCGRLTTVTLACIPLHSDPFLLLSFPPPSPLPPPTPLYQVLYDIGVVSTKEPFQCLVNQGMILGEVRILWMA